MTLEPTQLTPTASLNRVIIPGDSSEAAVLTATAFSLLSAAALSNLVRPHANDLGLTQIESESQALLPAFDARLTSSEPVRQQFATEIAETFVLRMSRLISTLKTGPLDARLARPEWDESYWRAWSAVRVVGLGGGLLAGNLGRFVARRLPEALSQANVDITVSLDAFPRFLPLIGAARSVSRPEPNAAVLDFGHSAVKRAVASYSAGALDRLRLLSPLSGASRATMRVEELGREVVRAISQTWRESALNGSKVSSEIVCSVACYLLGGQPYPQSTGVYAPLRDLSPNLASWLSQQVSAELARPVEVRLVHDGSAAAMAYSGARDMAVIMFGTALGVGFAPPEPPLDVSANFAVQ